MEEKRTLHRNPWLWLFLVLFLVAAGIIAYLKGVFPIGPGANGAQDSYEEGFSQSLVESDPSQIPVYADADWVELTENIPCFTAADLDFVGADYAGLDRLERCGRAMAMLEPSMMPTEPREQIGQIRPTGWEQEKYPGIVDSNPPYLYNRCHLIAYALTGENANPRNLITGTRYLNVEIMLPWEKRVIRYLEETGNHVLYRVTPYFQDRELLARGVEMEAYSIEDEGAGLCFHVFLYNIQPGIELDYATGKSREMR